MAARNDITGDALRSKVLSEEGSKNWSDIFGTKRLVKCKLTEVPLYTLFLYQGLEHKKMDTKKYYTFSTGGMVTELEDIVVEVYEAV